MNVPTSSDRNPENTVHIVITLAPKKLACNFFTALQRVLFCFYIPLMSLLKIVCCTGVKYKNVVIKF